MIKACIFDLDGTILNTAESLLRPSNITLDSFKLEHITEDDVKRFVGNGYKTLVKRFMKYRGVDNEGIIEEARYIFSKEFEKDPSYHVVAYPGVSAALLYLKKMGIKLAVLSNKSDERAVKVVEDVFGSELFDVIWGAKEGVPLKPDPTSLVNLMSEMNINPQECLYFGDTDIDIQTGEKAGCPTVGCSWGYRSRKSLEEANCDYLIDDPDEICDLLKLINFTYEINGAKIKTVKDFYDSVYAQMMPDVDFIPGHNMDAFADAVRGGFGMHNDPEDCNFVWTDFQESRAYLDDGFIVDIINIITAEGSLLTIA